jgi:AcrR family transcriptional regulator
MRVSSISSSRVRVAPQQERSARRLAAFLEAAADLFAEVGFEAATMQAIADRSDSSIGALYNYFPDKQSIAVTLLNGYAEDLRVRLELMRGESKSFSTARYAGALIDCIFDFVRAWPAWLNLHAASLRSRRDPATRKALRSTVADALRAKNPALSAERAYLAANVTVQIVKGMKTLYMEGDAKARPAIEAEFRRILTAYLEGILCVDPNLRRATLA